MYRISRSSRTPAPESDLFDPGQIVSTPGALETFEAETLTESLHRHVTGDWGNLDEVDRAANDSAVINNGRILSSYHLSQGRLWIITEADRSVTTFLLPEEY